MPTWPTEETEDNIMRELAYVEHGDGMSVKLSQNHILWPVVLFAEFSPLVLFPQC
jgi:hypothetical protein